MMEFITEAYRQALPVIQSVTIYNFAATYAAMSFSTGLLSYFTVYRPILSSLEDYENENEEFLDIFELQSPFQTAIILITLNTLLAPLIFRTCLTGPDKEFVAAYINKILPDDDDDDY